MSFILVTSLTEQAFILQRFDADYKAVTERNYPTSSITQRKEIMRAKKM